RMTTCRRPSRRPVRDPSVQGIGVAGGPDRPLAKSPVYDCRSCGILPGWSLRGPVAGANREPTLAKSPVRVWGLGVFAGTRKADGGLGRGAGAAQLHGGAE